MGLLQRLNVEQGYMAMYNNNVWQLTTPEPLFIHTIVKEGFPVQAQLNTASDPRSTCKDWGSAAIRGPTGENKPGYKIYSERSHFKHNSCKFVLM